MGHTTAEGLHPLFGIQAGFGQVFESEKGGDSHPGQIGTGETG